jgi:hypothetical protein
MQKLILILLLMLITQTTRSSCPTEHKIEKRGLPYTFRVNYIDSSCINFRLVECVDYARSKVISNNYDVCTREICDPNVKYEQKTQAMDQCQ